MSLNNILHKKFLLSFLRLGEYSCIVWCILVDLASWWWFIVVVTSLGRSTKLLYARPGLYLDGWPSTDG